METHQRLIQSDCFLNQKVHDVELKEIKSQAGIGRILPNYNKNKFILPSKSQSDSLEQHEPTNLTLSQSGNKVKGIFKIRTKSNTSQGQQHTWKKNGDNNEKITKQSKPTKSQFNSKIAHASSKDITYQNQITKSLLKNECTNEYKKVQKGDMNQTKNVNIEKQEKKDSSDVSIQEPLENQSENDGKSLVINSTHCIPQQSKQLSKQYFEGNQNYVLKQEESKVKNQQQIEKKDLEYMQTNTEQQFQSKTIPIQISVNLKQDRQLEKYDQQNFEVQHEQDNINTINQNNQKCEHKIKNVELQVQIKPISNQVHLCNQTMTNQIQENQKNFNFDSHHQTHNESEQKINSNNSSSHVRKVQNDSQIKHCDQSKSQSIIALNLKQSYVKEGDKTNKLEKDQNNIQGVLTPFNIIEYGNIYDLLLNIHNTLKKPSINAQELLKFIKIYLEAIANGNMDNIDVFDIPLQKKKIIKNSLLFERVSVIMIAFAYVTHTIKDSLKFLINIMGYSLMSCSILFKVLQETQISETLHGSQNLKNSMIVKFDRITMKRNIEALRNNNNVLMDAFQKIYRINQSFAQNISQILKQTFKFSIEESFYNLLEYFSEFLCLSDVDHMIPFLAVAPNPYLSPEVTGGKWTLVIDFLEVFCNSKKAKNCIFRPYSQHFLNQMNTYFEIVSFSPAYSHQIDKIIDILDPKKSVKHRLYKHHTLNARDANSRNGRVSLKCVERIGRNLDKLILLDNETSGGKGSIENCIHIPSWKGNKNDTILAEICPLLAMIALKSMPAQQAISSIRNQVNKNQKDGVKYINFAMFQTDV